MPCCPAHGSLGTVVSSGVGPAVGLLRHMVVLCLVFKDISILFSIVAESVYIPTNCARGGFPFLHTLSSIYFYRFGFFWADDGHSDQCELIPPCSFDFHFSNNE